MHGCRKCSVGDISGPVGAHRQPSFRRIRRSCQGLACRLQDVEGFCRGRGVPNGDCPDFILYELLRVDDLSLCPALPILPAAYGYLEEQPRKKKSVANWSLDAVVCERGSTDLSAITICRSWSGEVHKWSEIALLAPRGKRRLKKEELY